MDPSLSSRQRPWVLFSFPYVRLIGAYRNGLEPAARLQGQKLYQHHNARWIPRKDRGKMYVSLLLF